MMMASIPLIRAAALSPMLRWLSASGRSAEQVLGAADLRYASHCSPEAPIPLFNVFRAFRELGALAGPDAPIRTLTQHSLADLGIFGRVILGSKTPRLALERAAAVLPRYSTHELLALHPIPSGLCVRAGWSFLLDDVTLHLTQQFTAALIQGLCAATGLKDPTRSVRLRPHPIHGLDHIRPWLGTIDKAAGATLDVEIDNSVLDAPLHLPATEALAMPPVGWAILKGDSSFSHSVRIVLAVMADDQPVSVERIAQSAGMSKRSVQRALTLEGTSFRRLVDENRRAMVLSALSMEEPRISSVSADIGYTQQSSLTRAVRRWTGVSPSKFAAMHPTWTAKETEVPAKLPDGALQQDVDGTAPSSR